MAVVYRFCVVKRKRIHYNEIVIAITIKRKEGQRDEDMEKGAWAGFGACVPDNFVGGGLAESKSVMCDGVTLTGDPLKENVDYTFDKDTHLLTIKTAGEYTLSGTAKDQNFRVKVGEKASRIQTTLTIDNLTINTYIKEDEEHAPQGYSPLDFSDAGATTLILVGKNHLTARAQNPAVFAPKVAKDGDLVDQLTIGGEGSLVAQGGYAWPGIGNTGSAKIRIEGGNITAKGGEAAAGIGGSWGHWFDSIVITGGRVVATGGAWANNDIGCGYAPSQKPNHGTNREHVISIEGGVVEANSIFEDTNKNTLKKTGGILVQNGEYTVLGDTKLTTNLTILEGKTLTVPSGKTITIEKNGKLEIEKGAKLYVDGTVEGNITGAGKIYYKLNYDLDGGEWKNGYKPEDYYLSGAAFDLPTEENLNKAGYTLSGWTEKGKKDVVWKIPATATGIKNVVAQWTANTYTVTIKADKDGKVIESQQIPEGGLAKKPAKEPVREGYTFIGWQANGAAWDFDQNVVERDTEIIALWEKVVIAPDVAIEGGTSFIVGRATENAMVTIGHNVPGFGVANLAYVDVDGKKLNEKDYDVKTGSIKLNVHAAYLNTLSVGEHTLTAHLKGDGYDGQKVSAKLTISPVPDASGLPKTGDASAPMAWCALGLACLAGLAAMKRRK